MLDKKPIQAIFLFKFKMGHKAVETTHNSNNAFGQGTVTKVQCGGGSWSFAKMTRALEMRSALGPIRSWQQLVERNHQSWSFYNNTRSCQQLKIDHSMVIRHLKQIGKVKKLGKWVTHELIANQKNWFFWFSFWSIIFSYSMQQQWDISQLDCDMRWQMDFIWQPVMISSVVRRRRSSKAKLVPRKGNGHCLVVCCLSEPLQLSESWWNHYI